MTYFMINKEPVFLFGSRYRRILEEALSDQDALFKIDSMVKGSDEAKEVEEMMYEVLKDKYADDPDLFYSEWINFDIAGKEASTNVWELLYDYGQFYGYSDVSDVNKIYQKSSFQSEDEKNTYPGARILSLNHLVQPKKWGLNYIPKKLKKYFPQEAGRTIKLIIIPKNVYRLVGNLSDFMVFSKDYHQVRK